MHEAQHQRPHRQTLGMAEHSARTRRSGTNSPHTVEDGESSSGQRSTAESRRSGAQCRRPQICTQNAAAEAERAAVTSQVRAA